MPKVDKVTKNSVTLSWGKPLRDGGAKITGYLIEKRPKGAKQWDIINTIPHPDTTFTVRCFALCVLSDSILELIFQKDKTKSFVNSSVKSVTTHEKRNS